MANQKFDSHSPIAIAALKQQWRIRLKKIRQELSPDRHKKASLDACQQLIKKCTEARLVLSFASFGSEIDLWPFNQKLAEDGRLVLPVITEENRLTLFQVDHFSQLKRHQWSILEPNLSVCAPIDISLIDVALIPGLGFDLITKYRLGYGRGYYDRLLASISTKHTWGIGFEEQAVEDLPYSPEDIPLENICLF